MSDFAFPKRAEQLLKDDTVRQILPTNLDEARIEHKKRTTDRKRRRNSNRRNLEMKYICEEMTKRHKDRASHSSAEGR